MSTPVPGTFVPSVFSFESQQLRVVVIDGEPWFIAADVCAILDLGNPTKAVLALDEDEKTLTSIQGIHANAGNPNVNIINDSGLYTLILRCRDAVKPGSLPHRFRKKVTSEILPAIRKTGKYEVPSQASDIYFYHSTARMDIELDANRAFTVRLTAIDEHNVADMLKATARALCELVDQKLLKPIASQAWRAAA